MADNKDCDHVFVSSEVTRMEWCQANANCCRVTRWMLHCAQCAEIKFVDDPDQPQLTRDAPESTD